MLTGDETVTSGNAFVGGYSILSNLTEAQQNLGMPLKRFVSKSLIHINLMNRLLPSRRRSTIAPYRC